MFVMLPLAAIAAVVLAAISIAAAFLIGTGVVMAVQWLAG